jgi:hypothetical protein
MTQLFAFDVAVTETVGDDALGYYDPESQQFVWAGDGEVTLGAALCTKVTSGTRHSACRSTGSSCVYDGGCPTGFTCYRCDYG